MKAKNLPGIPVVVYSCPLSSKIPALNNPFALRCKEIIEQSRHIWGYFSDEYKSCCYEIVDGEEVPKKFPPYSTLKLTSARSIQSWYTEHSDLILTSQKTPEAIKKAVQDVRRYARPGIESSIKDKEILAIFAIYEAFDALHKIQRGNSEDAIKEKILSASTFLNLAKAGTEPATQDTSKVQGITTFPLPSGAKASDAEIVFLDGQTVRVYIKGQPKKVFNYAEMGFKDGKTGKPNKLWLELSLYVDGNGNTNQKDSERINKTLQKFFKTKLKLLNKTQIFFKIRRQTKSDNNQPTRGVYRECPVCKDRHKDYCSVCKTETEHCRECHDELNETQHKELSIT